MSVLTSASKLDTVLSPLFEASLRASPKVWLVTGAAGFIGSHLVEQLLLLDQTVTGLDNFSTGNPANLNDLRKRLGEARWSRFRFVEGDIEVLESCRCAIVGVDYVLHQAALGSVPRSIADPLRSHGSNVNGFINMLIASRDAGVTKMVYASSSSVYGDLPELPKREERVGRPLSPYAATKAINELYAEVFVRTYGISVVGLRYFNVFGARQDPNGAYAAVIPRWFAALVRGEQPQINGDGETSRDFCYVANAVQANLLAATCRDPRGSNTVFNIACGHRTTLSQLFEAICRRVVEVNPGAARITPQFAPERVGDVRHSLADISRARAILGYEPSHSLEAGLDEAARWYLNASSADGGRE